MFWYRNSAPNYSKLHPKDENCNNNNCEECLIKELLRENWQDKKENVFLKIAYEKNIIRNTAASIRELDEEDRKNLERINFLYTLKSYCI